MTIFLNKHHSTAGLWLMAVICAAFYSATVFSAGRIVGGVDVDAVDWATLCANVEPIPLKTKDNACPAAHPGSSLHEDQGTTYYGGHAPKLDCNFVFKEYQDFKKPKSGPLPWFHCLNAFETSLQKRSLFPDMFSEPFETWRARYFTVSAP